MRPGTRRRLRRAVAGRAGATEGRGADAGCAYCGLRVAIEWPVGGEPLFYAAVWAADLWGGHGYYFSESAHLDHVIPESRNGPTSLDNTVISCPPCNMAKGDSAPGDPGFLVWLVERRALIASRSAVVT